MQFFFENMAILEKIAKIAAYILYFEKKYLRVMEWPIIAAETYFKLHKAKGKYHIFDTY